MCSKVLHQVKGSTTLPFQSCWHFNQDNGDTGIGLRGHSKPYWWSRMQNQGCWPVRWTWCHVSNTKRPPRQTIPAASVPTANVFAVQELWIQGKLHLIMISFSLHRFICFLSSQNGSLLMAPNIQTWAFWQSHCCPRVSPSADNIGCLSRRQTQEAEESPGRPSLQINGHARPMGREQRESDQCGRGREQKPLSICLHQVGRGERVHSPHPLLMNGSASSGSH